MDETKGPADGVRSEDGVRSQDGVRLSKDERKSLLAEIERMSSRTESPEFLVQRGQQAIASGNIQQARRILAQLEETAPHVPGINYLRMQIDNQEKAAKLAANIHSTEEMLMRAIQKRQKQLAQMALQTLVDLAPDHPRLAEYRVWVKEVDQEVAMQGRIDAALAVGRAALQSGQVDEARRSLEALEKLDPSSSAVERFRDEVETAIRARAAGAGIERYKKEIEDSFAAGNLDAARYAIDKLGSLDVPKITLDFYQKRLQEMMQRQRDQLDSTVINTDLEVALSRRDWATAREVAQKFSLRFPNDPRAGAVFHRINHLEADQRREQAKDQGIATLEQFIAQGRKAEAQLALKLLRNLNVDPAALAAFEARVNALT